MFKFKIGDEILVTSGKDKGKKGKVQKILPKVNKVVVSQVNVHKRHKKASRNRSAGIYEVESPIPVANIAIICPKCAKPTRIGFVLEDETKTRICKICKGVLK